MLGDHTIMPVPRTKPGEIADSRRGKKKKKKEGMGRKRRKEEEEEEETESKIIKKKQHMRAHIYARSHACAPKKYVQPRVAQHTARNMHA